MYLRCFNIHNNMNFGVLFLTFRSGKMTISDRSVTFRVKLNAIIDQNLEKNHYYESQLCFEMS